MLERRSFPYKLTPEDRVIISRWKVRVGMVYGAVLIALLLFVVRPSHQSTEIVKATAIPGFAPASLMPALPSSPPD
jgi:hypothetical protein